MEIKPGDTVLLTGASGGLGTFMAMAFAKHKVRQALVAHPGGNLEELQKAVEKRGGAAAVFVCDLRDAAQRKQMLDDVRRQFGSIDILINNAGVEFTSSYHELSEEDLQYAPREPGGSDDLTRLVLPEMLERKRGHVAKFRRSRENKVRVSGTLCRDQGRADRLYIFPACDLPSAWCKRVGDCAGICRGRHLRQTESQVGLLHAGPVGHVAAGKNSPRGASRHSERFAGNHRQSATRSSTAGVHGLVPVAGRIGD